MSRFRILPERSRVWIDATSSVHPIHSETSEVEGWWEAEMEDGGRIDGQSPPRGYLELAVGRLTSGNALLDREMRRRIDARRHPVISGELTELQAIPTNGNHLARGDVTFRGVTRPVDGELKVSLDDERTVRIAGERVFDIRDFGLEPPKLLMLRVHPEVSVRINVVAERED
jgi:polyisoprenoid-binding protein YceI